MKQIIFVVETNKSIQSDNRYIKKLISLRYNLSSNEIRIQYVHMNGKSHYNDNSVLSQIKKYCKENKNGINHVIYCFDTDEIDIQYRYKEEYKKEKQFCKKNDFLMVWFNYDIEYVLLGRRVESNKKKEESIKYLKYNQNISIMKLCEINEELKGYSNFYLILDDILPIKKDLM